MSPLYGKKYQRGASLFIALVLLVAMSFAGIAMLRSVDTTNMISGNLAFRQSALQVSDVGIELAFKALETMSLVSDITSGSSCPSCRYYASERCLDSRGLPTQTAKLPYPSTCPASPSLITDAIWTQNISPTNVNGYSVRYVIERLCDQSGTITDLKAHCYGYEELGGGSKKIGATTFSRNMTDYRITVRVDGPRNTVVYVQAILEK